MFGEAVFSSSRVSILDSWEGHMPLLQPSLPCAGEQNHRLGFLSQAPQPPSEDSVNAAVNVLKEVGAIEVNDYPPSSKKRKEKFTPLGFHLAKLPVGGWVVNPVHDTLRANTKL